ncbi:branched-chain amino acid ABC transporter substrate-binding protein [Staphylospora marina]|uniref:branched-chain amino acid ABC transporter substrate-binding protein n=1 Tax=Staphylospora marina TaxID=2490858 RepID=UPI000F5BF9EA|nr:branched-chain amino acid ABC transporter substrate-binding protein [Staphylospora marina]
MKKVLSMFSVIALLSATAIGCGGGGQTAKEETIKIATQSPLSGNSATLGEAIKLGAQMALEENKEKFKQMGFNIELLPMDDQGDPKKGVANAQQIGADQSVLGVVGHLNSGVAIPSSVVYEKFKLAMVSPANTAIEITERGMKSVNRICARDDFQGPAAAAYALNDLKAKNIFVIQDKTAYGQGLADNFKSAAEKMGANIVGYEGITIGEKDFNGVLNQVAAKKPDLVYFGGLYAEGGILVKQAREKGLNIPIMGGDGLDSSTIVQIAGDSIKNTFYTSVAADVSKSPKGKEWADAYEKKFGKKPESFSFYGYDAMGVLLKGLEDAIKQNGNKKPTREQVMNAVRAIQDYEGVATKVAFDEKGDNKYAKVFIFKFDNQAYPGTLVGEKSKN